VCRQPAAAAHSTQSSADGGAAGGADGPANGCHGGIGWHATARSHGRRSTCSGHGPGLLWGATHPRAGKRECAGVSAAVLAAVRAGSARPWCACRGRVTWRALASPGEAKFVDAAAQRRVWHRRPPYPLRPAPPPATHTHTHTHTKTRTHTHTHTHAPTDPGSARRVPAQHAGPDCAGALCGQLQHAARHQASAGLPQAASPVQPHAHPRRGPHAADHTQVCVGVRACVCACACACVCVCVCVRACVCVCVCVEALSSCLCSRWPGCRAWVWVWARHTHTHHATGARARAGAVCCEARCWLMRV
jgi:hypothetical protein